MNNYKNGRPPVLGESVIGVDLDGDTFAGSFTGIDTQAQTLEQRLIVHVHSLTSGNPAHPKSNWASGSVIAQPEKCYLASDAINGEVAKYEAPPKPQPIASGVPEAEAKQ